MLTVYLSGLTVGLGLIVAIGGQNAWLLGMAVQRNHPWPAALVCMLVDVVLIAVGVVAFGAIKTWLPGVVPIFTGLGIIMLAFLASQHGMNAWRGRNLALASHQPRRSAGRISVVVTALLMSLLNPHVYLDTVLLLGNVATSSPLPWVFWFGASSASILWFAALAALGVPLSRWLVSVLRWRIFDSVIAVLLCWVAFGLLRYL